MTPAEILTKAADVIEQRGWYQGGWMPVIRRVDKAICPVCVLAAINVAAGHRPDDDFGMADERQDAATALADYLGLRDQLEDHEEESFEHVIGNNWNDCTATSAEQVVAALREAARMAGSAS